MNPDPALVQAIVVPPAPKGSDVDPRGAFGHAAVLEAVVAASLRALEQGTRTGTHQDTYRRWLAGSFTKTVRVARRPSHLDRMLTEAQWPAVAQGSRGGVALAYHPMAYQDFSALLAGTRVAGLDRPRLDPARDVPTGRPLVVLNAALGMSTGKSAAQAAHAAMSWWLAHAEPGRVPVPPLLPAVLEVEADVFAALWPGATVQIHDAGHTEVAPGTATALCLGAGEVTS